MAWPQKFYIQTVEERESRQGKRVDKSKEIEMCFRLAFMIGSQFDFFVIVIARFKMIYV